MRTSDRPRREPRSPRGGTTRRRALGLIAGGIGLAGLSPRIASGQTRDLVGRMTLGEKIGQLTMLSADFTVTGPVVPGNVDADLRAGGVGSLFNLWGRAAQGAECVILCLGEAAHMSGEAASRARLDLPGRQAELAQAVLATGRPVVILLFSGRPLILPEAFDRAGAILACWFPGSEAGHGVADLLTGARAPSAGLAVSWPRAVGQLPLAFSERSGGRPDNPDDKYTSKYLDIANSPLFAFGYGLSYTRFDLSTPIVSVSERITVAAELVNTGERAGETTVFLFMRDRVASIARPVLELRRFIRVALEPGQKTAVRFELERDDFAFPGEDLRPIVEPGEIEIHLGFSAERSLLRNTRFTLR